MRSRYLYVLLSVVLTLPTTPSPPFLHHGAFHCPYCPSHLWPLPFEPGGWLSFVEERLGGGGEGGVLEEHAPPHACPLELVVALALEVTHTLRHPEDHERAQRQRARDER